MLRDSEDLSRIQVSTVDAFQGAERDVIILTVGRTEQLGFSVSPKRLNVAITRARRHLIVIGHPRLLRANQLWNAVIEPAYSNMQGGAIQNCSRILSHKGLELPAPDSVTTVT